MNGSLVFISFIITSQKRESNDVRENKFPGFKNNGQPKYEFLENQIVVEVIILVPPPSHS